MKKLLTNLLLCGSLLAQTNTGDPTNSSIWSFTEQNNTGCAPLGVLQCPRFDPYHFGGCNLPPYLCPPRSISYQDNATLWFDRVPTNTFTIVLASFAWEAQNALGPCIYPYPNIIVAGMSNSYGEFQFTFNLPGIIDPSFTGATGIMQLFNIDSGGNFLSTSNIIDMAVH